MAGRLLIRLVEADAAVRAHLDRAPADQIRADANGDRAERNAAARTGDAAQWADMQIGSAENGRQKDQTPIRKAIVKSGHNPKQTWYEGGERELRPTPPLAPEVVADCHGLGSYRVQSDRATGRLALSVRNVRNVRNVLPRTGVRPSETSGVSIDTGHSDTPRTRTPDFHARPDFGRWDQGKRGCARAAAIVWGRGRHG